MVAAAIILVALAAFIGGDIALLRHSSGETRWQDPAARSLWLGLAGSLALIAVAAAIADATLCVVLGMSSPVAVATGCVATAVGYAGAWQAATKLRRFTAAATVPEEGRDFA
jgi:hypothetical protein